jgi:ATP-dependent DNA helicase RecG
MLSFDSFVSDEPQNNDGHSPKPGLQFSLAFDREFSDDLASLSGVGPKTIERLRERGVVDQRGLLMLFPTRYRCVHRGFSGPTVAENGWEYVEVVGRVERIERPPAKSRRPLQVVVDCQGEPFRLVWFNVNRSNFTNRFRVGQEIAFSGQVDFSRGAPQLAHPLLHESVSSIEKGIIWEPMYPSFEGIRDAILKRAIHAACERIIPWVVDTLPDNVRRRRGLASIRQVLRDMHGLDVSPDDFEERVRRARYRLAYEEFFRLQEHLVSRYYVRRSVAQAPALADRTLQKKIIDDLPFQLTQDQQQACEEIVGDLGLETPMIRLLQGDVGSGKTIVAWAAASVAVGSGVQVAMMVPTEVLARQHFDRAKEIFGARGVRVDLLVGSLSAGDRRAVLEGLQCGATSIVIGTQALLSQEVHFCGTGDRAQEPLVGSRSATRGLGLVVVDEQHKFGVRQRDTLRQKGGHPHYLAMSATPIPRSLAYTVYGDLDLTLVRQKPPGRRPIQTHLWPFQRSAKVYARIRERVKERGEQAYVIFPCVESIGTDSGKSVLAGAERLANGPLEGLRVAILHGKMSSSDKDTTMRDFAEGRSDILCATTVVEVGLDVENASLIVIEHPEYFGLSQLHQLRGRVGRGSQDSACILLYGPDIGEPALERLAAFQESDDGFHLSEVDLRLRGPGQFLGNRQAGATEFLFADLVRDADILEQARIDARGQFVTEPRHS